MLVRSFVYFYALYDLRCHCAFFKCRWFRNISKHRRFWILVLLYKVLIPLLPWSCTAFYLLIFLFQHVTHGLTSIPLTCPLSLKRLIKYALSTEFLLSHEFIISLYTWMCCIEILTSFHCDDIKMCIMRIYNAMMRNRWQLTSRQKLKWLQETG